MDSVQARPPTVEWTKDKKDKLDMRLYRQEDFVRTLIEEGLHDGTTRTN